MPSKLLYLLLGIRGSGSVVLLNKGLHGVYSTIAAVLLLFGAIAIIGSSSLVAVVAFGLYVAWTLAFLLVMKQA